MFQNSKFECLYLPVLTKPSSLYHKHQFKLSPIPKQRLSFRWLDNPWLRAPSA